MRFLVILCFAAAASACFDLNGANFGALGQQCWTDEPRCDEGLTCVESRCSIVEPLSCVESVDCSTGDRACIDGFCVTYIAACDSDALCRPDYFCSANRVCAKRERNSVECSRDVECLSGFCRDGVCCAQDCGDECRACANQKTGGQQGECLPVRSGTDPDDECPGTTVCGSSACALFELGSACTTNVECATSFCSDGICCDAACDGPCMECAAGGQCRPIASREDAGRCDDANFGGDCAAPPCVCDGGGKCASGGGVACASGANCPASQWCVDGVCCNTECTGHCMACAASKTGSSSGLCAPVANGADPENECAGGAACDGNGTCYSGRGGCRFDYQCESGICAHSPEYTSRTNTIGQIVTGLCCDQRCEASCWTCFGTVNDQNQGRCHQQPRHRDDFEDCHDDGNVQGETRACGGPSYQSGASCTRRSGQNCTSNDDCRSDQCSVDCRPLLGGGTVCDCN